MMSDSGYKFSEEYEVCACQYFVVCIQDRPHLFIESDCCWNWSTRRDASLMPENRAKNRYTNILAYDQIPSEVIIY